MYECDPVDLSFVASTKYRFQAVVEIDATPDQVFDAFEDADAWPKWALPITKVEWTSPKPFGVGTTRTVSMMGGLVGEEVFIAWDRGKRMAFRFERASQNNVKAFAEDYIVEELGPGRTKVTWIMAMEPAGPGKITMPLFKPFMGMGLQWMLGRFKKYVENA